MNVVFIGNSYTHSHEMPATVAAMSRHMGKPDLAWRMHAPPGWSFAEHLGDEAWRQEGMGSTEVLVLQNHSYGAIADPTLMIQQAGQLIRNWVRAHPQVRVILFSTWAYKNPALVNPNIPHFPAARHPSSAAEMLAQVTQVYATIARLFDVEIAPVGQAWADALGNMPELPLHGPDGHHPDPLGSALAARVLVQVILNTTHRLDARSWRSILEGSGSAPTDDAIAVLEQAAIMAIHS